MNQSSSGDQRIDFIGPVRNMQMCTTYMGRLAAIGDKNRPYAGGFLAPLVSWLNSRLEMVVMVMGSPSLR